MIFKTPAGLRVLDLTGCVSHDDGDLWSAIDRYDEIHGTLFWHHLAPEDYIGWDPHFMYDVPRLAPLDFVEES